MSSLGQAWMGLINRLADIRRSKPVIKIERSQHLIAASQGPGSINAGCRRMGVLCLAEAVVAKDREEAA